MRFGPSLTRMENGKFYNRVFRRRQHFVHFFFHAVLSRRMFTSIFVHPSKHLCLIMRLRCVRCVNETRKKRKSLRWQAANHGCFDRAFLLAGACVFLVKISRNKRKRQPIGMLGRSSGNHDWLLANASVCV